MTNENTVRTSHELQQEKALPVISFAISVALNTSLVTLHVIIHLSLMLHTGTEGERHMTSMN